MKDELKTSILAGIFEEVSFRWLGFYSAIFAFWGVDQLTREIWASGWWRDINSNLWLSIPLIICALIVVNFIGLVANAFLSDKSIDGCLINIIAGTIAICVIVVDLAAGLVVIWSWTKWSFDVLFIPAVNIITQGRLAEQLYGYGWAVTAAIVSVNWNFGKGHGYQGLIGLVNAWIIGMIMFWVTFNFGFPVAVMIHAGYDVLINLIVAGDAAAELAVSK